MATPRMIDITGQKFSKLLVLKRVETPVDCAPSMIKMAHFLCRCDCGKELVIVGQSLRKGRTKSCGCIRPESMQKYARETAIDLTGATFGFLTYVREAGTRAVTISKGVQANRRVVVCSCACGSGEKEYLAHELLGNRQRNNCGCLNKKAFGERSRAMNLRNGPLTPAKDYTGHVFGELVVLRKAQEYEKTERQRLSVYHRIYWIARCKCGSESCYDISTLKSGNTSRCFKCGREATGQKIIARNLSSRGRRTLP